MEGEVRTTVSPDEIDDEYMALINSFTQDHATDRRLGGTSGVAGYQKIYPMVRRKRMLRKYGPEYVANADALKWHKAFNRTFHEGLKNDNRYRWQ